MFKLINKRKLDYTNSSPLAHMILYWHLCGTYQWHNECFKRFNSFSNLSRYLSLERFVLSNTFDNFIFSMISMFMGFSRQEYWSGLPFPSPVDHVLSELSTMTCPSWVALHGMAHNFIELDKAVVHVISLVSFLCGFHSVCPLRIKIRGLWKLQDARDWLGETGSWSCLVNL